MTSSATSTSLHPSVSRRLRLPTSWAFLLPTMVVMAVLFLWPLWQAASMSFTDASGTGLSLSNYGRVLQDSRFHNAARVSVIYTVGVVIGSIVVGMAAALLLNRAIAGRAALRALFIMPWAMPFVATALIWRWMLDSQYGIATYVLDVIGFSDVPNAFNSGFALLTVSMIEVWKTFPLAVIMFLAGMQTIPQEQYEAASMDGAGAWRRFRYITIPGLRFTTRVLTLLLTLWVFGRAFMIIFLTTGGGPAGSTETLVLLTYLRGFGQFDLDAAAALGMVVLFIALVLTVAYLRTARDED